MPNKEKRSDDPVRRGTYPRIPDHSDLRGFSYRAPTAFDYRDEFKKRGFWEKIRAALKLEEV